MLFLCLHYASWQVEQFIWQQWELFLFFPLWYKHEDTFSSVSSVVTCEMPANPDNGKRILGSEETLQSYGSVIKFVCNEGYTLVGNDSITCTETGDYDSPPPQCKGTSTASTCLICYSMDWRERWTKPRACYLANFFNSHTVGFACLNTPFTKSPYEYCWPFSNYSITAQTDFQSCQAETEPLVCTHYTAVLKSLCADLRGKQKRQRLRKCSPWWITAPI